ncbi:MAG: hypothetical protein RIQ81_749 [Pseudomonadota bacterium]|jgi:hypothetical protein
MNSARHFDQLAVCLFGVSLFFGPSQKLLAQGKPSDTIEVRRESGYSADAKVGSYGQPEWTAHRHFATSRTYVIPEGTLAFESWAKIHRYKDGTFNDTLLRQEIEYGLTNRLQLDLYVNQINEVRDGKRVWDTEGVQYEVRWAMADWGQLPANPTWYLEYHWVKNAPEKAEVRLLLADNLAPAWHYSINAGYEIELWGEERERELIATAAVGTTSLFPTLSIGAEIKREWVDTKDNRGHMQGETMIGPSFNWRPVRWAHLDVAPLFGLEEDAPRNEVWLIAGAELK